MIDCLIERDSEKKKWLPCPQCGWTYTGDSSTAPMRSCPKAPLVIAAGEVLGIVASDVPSYAPLLRKWLSAGKPFRLFAESKDVIETHCIQCDQHHDGKCHAAKQGCNKLVMERSIWVLARMKTAHCPEGKW